jgi:hypothetical protein
MEHFERLDMILGGELQARGGILDQLDYIRLRRLGSQLRDIPKPSEDWDLAPGTLQRWIASFEASKQVFEVMSKSGLMQLLQENGDEIRTALSRNMIPAIDAEIADPATIDEIIASVKAHDRVKQFDFERFRSDAPSKEGIAHALVVELNVHVPYDKRPKVSKKTGLKRLQAGTFIGQAALGGGLAVGNLSLGVVGGIITSIPAILGAVPLTLGLVGSTYTGCNAVLSAVEKLAGTLRN